MSFIKEQLKSDVVGFNIVDNATNPVYKNSEYVDFEFDFPKTAGTFYADMENFVKYYNIYAESRDGKGDYDTDTVNAASIYIESFTKDPSSMIPDFNTKYIQGYPRESVYTGTDMAMKTIGITLLFLVAVALIYILLFHFRFIKRIVTRGRSEGNYVAKDTKNNSKYQVKPEAIKNTSKKEEVKKEQIDRGVLYTSGLIAGEGLVGVLLAIFAVIKIGESSLADNNVYLQYFWLDLFLFLYLHI